MVAVAVVRRALQYPLPPAPAPPQVSLIGVGTCRYSTSYGGVLRYIHPFTAHESCEAEPCSHK